MRILRKQRLLLLLLTHDVESFLTHTRISLLESAAKSRFSRLPTKEGSSSEFDDDAEADIRANGDKGRGDSLQQYERDVTKVLRELRPWKYDPSIPGWFRRRRLSFTNYWGLSDWEVHTSRKRFIRYILDFPKSRLLRRLYPQLTVLMVWSLISVRVAQQYFGPYRLKVETTALSLVSTFVAAIQTLRSNQGLGRLADARLAMGHMVLYTRDLGNLVKL